MVMTWKKIKESENLIDLLEMPQHDSIVEADVVNVVQDFRLGTEALQDEGYYQGGKFQFETEVPDAYNMVFIERTFNRWHWLGSNQDIKVRKELKESGAGMAIGNIRKLQMMFPSVCLWIQTVISPFQPRLVYGHLGTGSEHLLISIPRDVVWGLNSLFTDLLNFDDPLNIEAAEHHLRDKPNLELFDTLMLHYFAQICMEEFGFGFTFPKCQKFSDDSKQLENLP
ncbi:hypothetical protein WISP_53221 [Willisornis vidua]|uniref:Uncharacterized protein n=1 Tax=Willisornis vidua TaxID=1566151 RepID=A0ABQ9DHJ5_9PASS|nr:hypothetical protein WISP_53221 [Willisornis vidua]